MQSNNFSVTLFCTRTFRLQAGQSRQLIHPLVDLTPAQQHTFSVESGSQNERFKKVGKSTLTPANCTAVIWLARSVLVRDGVNLMTRRGLSWVRSERSLLHKT